MNLLHFRYRNRLGLLAEGVLGPKEAEEVSKHTALCRSCREELARLQGTVARLAEDAATNRPLPISSDALRTRVRVLLRAESARSAPQRAWSLAPALGALGLVGVSLVAVLISRSSPSGRSSPSPRAFEATAETAVNDAAFYERLEKTRVRASASRYLAEAQDVLIQVTAAADCPDSPKDSVDVGREAQTSRTLLKRRAALVSGSGETLMAARGVLEEVEGVLQQVADLPQCTRRTEVSAIARRVDRKNLLMKIDLVSQELAAP